MQRCVCRYVYCAHTCESQRKMCVTLYRHLSYSLETGVLVECGTRLEPEGSVILLFTCVSLPTAGVTGTHVSLPGFT